MIRKALAAMLAVAATGPEGLAAALRARVQQAPVLHVVRLCKQEAVAIVQVRIILAELVAVVAEGERLR